MRLTPNHAAVAALAIGSVLASAVFAAEPAMDEAARMQYALGYQLGRDLTVVESRPQDLLKGLEDGRAGAKPKLSDAELSAALAGLQQKVSEQRARDQAAASLKAIADGKTYLAANAKKPGVITTASGLQYRVVTQGSGKTPTAGDTVTVALLGSSAFEDYHLVSPDFELFEDASGDTIPELEIMTNDVKCSHAAAVGPIDEEQVFFCTSRGLSPAVILEKGTQLIS